MARWQAAPGQLSGEPCCPRGRPGLPWGRGPAIAGCTTRCTRVQWPVVQLAAGAGDLFGQLPSCSWPAACVDARQASRRARLLSEHDRGRATERSGKIDFTRKSLTNVWSDGQWNSLLLLARHFHHLCMYRVAGRVTLPLGHQANLTDKGFHFSTQNCIQADIQTTSTHES